MPKIRGVKPDYWTDEDIVELSIPARLLFIGMWNYACDNGHLQDKPKQIKMRILPGDDLKIGDLLSELCTRGRIKRGDGWITVPNLTEHQKPDRRYFTTCDFPGCEEPEETTSQRKSRRVHGVHTTGAQGAHVGRTPGALGDGDGDVMVKGSDGDRPAASKRAAQLPNDWRPNADHHTFAAANFLDLPAEAEQFADHHRAKGSAMKDWDAAFRTWLRNAVKWRKDSSVQPRPRVLPQAHELELPPDGLSPEQYAKWDADQRAKRLA